MAWGNNSELNGNITVSIPVRQVGFILLVYL